MGGKQISLNNQNKPVSSLREGGNSGTTSEIPVPTELAEFDKAARVRFQFPDLSDRLDCLPQDVEAGLAQQMGEVRGERWVTPRIVTQANTEFEDRQRNSNQSASLDSFDNVETMTNSSEASESESLAPETSSPWKQRMRFTFPSGSTPLKGYTIKRGLGIGGFGEVYFAVSDSGKEVALKRIARNLDVELRGVRQCLNLKHANLIGLWDIQVDDHHENWVVMEYVSGPSLRDVLQANPNGLPMDDVIWWFQGITAGVHYLHQNGIVHRDLKPGNIFHDNEAQLVKIGDYGLSKFISCSRRSGHTESVGTVHYMAPEIGRGIYGREIDVYSLGIVLFELLTGHVPFEGQCSQEIIMKHLTADPDVSALSAPFDKVVRHALLKDPEQRYSTVLEMIADLPKEFWPASLRRSVMQLQDTGKHEFPAVIVAQNENTQNEHTQNENTQNENTQNENTQNENTQNEHTQAETSTKGEQATSPNSTPAVSPSSRNPLENSRPEGPRQVSPVLPQSGSISASGRRLVSNGEFNVPPQAARSSKHSVTQQAAIFYSDAARPVRSNDPQTPLRSAATANAGVVFGDVQFHDIVDAEVVEVAPTKQPLPMKSSIGGIGNTQDGLNRSVSRAERSSWLKSPRYVQAAQRYLHQLSGTERLTSLLQGFLLSSVVMFGVSVLMAILQSGSVATATGADNLFTFCVWMGLVGTFGSWLLLSFGMLWAPSTNSTGLKYLSLVPVCVALAGLAFTVSTISDVLFVPFAGSNGLLIRGYLGTLLNFAGSPQPLGCFLFFLVASLIGRWWTQTSPIRVHWLSIFPVLRSALGGLVGSVFLGTGVWVPALLMAGISVAIQCAAPYFTDSQRLDIRRQQG